MTRQKDAGLRQRKVHYGISDLIVDEHDVPAKYVTVLDRNGEFLAEVEVYIIGYEYEEE